VITDRDLKFFEVAKSMAALSTWSDEVASQVGAVIVLRNEIVATGFNRNKGNLVHGIFSQMVDRPEAYVAHAETSALNNLFRKPSGSWFVTEKERREAKLMKLYVYRETTHGIAMAKPCNICTAAIKYFGIGTVCYSTKDGFVMEKWK
jgi:deoxycytidylate deaminase